MKNLAILFVACLAPMTSFSEGAPRGPIQEQARPSASVALLCALDSVFEVASESSLELLSAESHVVEATEAKATHVLVELDLIVRADGGASAESDFGVLRKAFAKRAADPNLKPASYELFRSTLLRIGGEGDALSGRAGVPSVIPGGTHRGMLRAEFPLAAIPTYPGHGAKEEHSGSSMESAGELALYVRTIAQHKKVQFGAVEARPSSKPVIGGIRHDLEVVRRGRANDAEAPLPIDFPRISNLLYILETKSTRAVVTSIELGPVVKGLAKSFEFQLSVYE